MPKHYNKVKKWKLFVLNMLISLQLSTSGGPKSWSLGVSSRVAAPPPLPLWLSLFICHLLFSAWDRKKKGRSRASSTTPTPASTSATSRARSPSWSTRWAGGKAGPALFSSALCLTTDSDLILSFFTLGFDLALFHNFHNFFPQLVWIWQVLTTPRDFLCHADTSYSRCCFDALRGLR